VLNNPGKNAPCIFRIYATFDTAGVLMVQRAMTGAVVKVDTSTDANSAIEKLNRGNSLVASSAYIFDVEVDVGESIALMYSEDAIALKLAIYEVDSQ
jgi:hypothetical protein